MRRPDRIMLIGIFLLAMPPLAFADTVSFTNGTTLYGKVVWRNENSVRINFGKGSMTVPASQIAHIEKNDKVGDLDLNRSHPLAEKRRQELVDRTGLTAEQRSLVRKVMAPLNTSDPQAVASARKRLIELNKEMNVFKFLEASLPFLTDRYVPEVMSTMVEMDATKAATVLQRGAHDVAPKNRAAALELLGKVQGSEEVERIACGLVDHDKGVRIAAAHGLAIAKDKRSTPALVEGLDSPDPQVCNACRGALRAIWSTESKTVDFDTPNQWKGFWSSRAASVEQPLDPSTLKPLVVPPPPEVATYHDE